MDRPLVSLVAAMAVLVMIGLLAVLSVFAGTDTLDAVAFINAWPKKYEGPMW